MTLNFRRTHRFALPAVLLTALAPAAFAIPAHIVATVHMRAGPSIEYPAVVRLIPGTPLEVYGCEAAYAWCDVQAGPNRGWVDADYVQVDSGGHPVVLAGAGVAVGVPIITFTLGTYWGSYYRTRPWYAQRAHYLSYWHRYPHGRPPPRPRPPIARPPVRPPPAVRPPPRPRPPAGNRPPQGGNRPPQGGDRPTPPGNGRPQPGNGTRPSPQP
jgi:uncharacterized protein YraI